MTKKETVNYTLHKLMFALDRAADAMLRDEFHISYSRALILITIQEQPGINQHQLAQALGRTDPAVSTMLAQLIEDGLIVSSPSPQHKRKNVVGLTAEGKTLAEQTGVFLNKKFESLLDTAGVDGELYDRLTKQLYATVVEGSR